MAPWLYGSLAPAALRVEPADGRPTLVFADRPRYQQVNGPTPADDGYALGMVVRTLLAATDEAMASSALLALADRCTAAEASDRPTAEATARQLRSISRDVLLGLTAPATELATATPGYVPTREDADQPEAPQRRRSPLRAPILVVGGVAALVLAVTAGTVAIVGRKSAGWRVEGHDRQRAGCHRHGVAEPHCQHDPAAGRSGRAAVPDAWFGGRAQRGIGAPSPPRR